MIWFQYFMAIEEENGEAVTDFLFLGSKFTANGDHSHEILEDNCFLAGKTDSVKPRQCKDITLLTKVHTVKAMVFPVVMYRCERCESWTIKKAEC